MCTTQNYFSSMMMTLGDLLRVSHVNTAKIGRLNKSSLTRHGDIGFLDEGDKAKLSRVMWGAKMCSDVLRRAPVQ